MPRSKSLRKYHKRRQSGGGWAYTGNSFLAAGGYPLEVRSVTDDCGVQKGGSCGCAARLQAGGTYETSVSSHELGKVPVIIPRNSCQNGGAAYPTTGVGYSMEHPVNLSGSAYMDVTRYHRGGTRRGVTRRGGTRRRNRRRW
jgi:hypothetical protein